MDRATINRYVEGGSKLRAAVAGLADQDLKALPVPGTWSIQQIVLHLMDSDLILADRMKRMIAEDNPTIIAYDESRFASELFYHDQSVEDAVAIFDLNRRQFGRVLTRLPESAFDRKGTHSVLGEARLGPYLEAAIRHLDHHLGFLHDKRKLLGKGL